MAPDWRVAAWTLMIALAAGAVFGLPAAFGMTRGGLAQSLRGDAFEAGVKHRRFRLQSALIVTQVAVSALLLINTGLLIHAATRAIHMDPGHAVQGILIARPNIRDLQYTAPQAARYLHELRDRVAALPGVTAVSWTGFEPIQSSCGAQAKTVGIDGTPGAAVQISCNEIGSGFPRAMGIRLLQGRDFGPGDEFTDANTVLVDERFARRYLPGNPLGRRIRIWNPEREAEVVGVVSSIKSLMFLAEHQPEVYMPLTGLRYLEGRLILAYNGPRAPLTRALQAAAAQLDKESSLAVHSVEEHVSLALSFVQLAALGVGTLGALALVLACTGVYGVVAFTVGRRRREIGVRMALGAGGGAVMRLLVWQSLRPVLAGGIIGTALAVAGSSLVRAKLYGVSPLDPLGFAAGLALLAAIALLAAVVPASAALRVDPAATLRHE
jgi:predicted permease